MKKGISPLQAQAQKLFKHTRSGSYGTRARYRGSVGQFILFLEEQFKLQNLKNISDKHIIAYVQYRQEKGLAAKTIKNDLAAIRYLHDMIPNARCKISDNQTLTRYISSFKLEKTPAIKGNRAWTSEEYQKMHEIALEIEKKHIDSERAQTARDFQEIAPLLRTMGLRIAEATLSSRTQAEHALRTGVYQVGKEAKNGKEREVPLSIEARQVFQRRLGQTQRGQKLFVQGHETSDQAINRLEKFLGNHRNKVETTDGKKLRTWTNPHTKKTIINNLTFHGLRYNYIQDRVQQEIEKGKNLEEAAQVVTKEVGHNRIEVIFIYTGGKENNNDGEK